MSTSVSGLSSNFFPSPENGFSTTIASSVSPGASTVQVASLAPYNNGDIAVLIVDPSDANAKQAFTGVVDKANSQLTSVIWTAGNNTQHIVGAVVVDYASATHIAMMTKGITKQHKQDGSHTGVTTDTLTASGIVSALSDVNVTGSLTVAGSLNPSAGSVKKAALEKPHYNAMYFSNADGSVFGNTEHIVPFNANDTTNANGVTVSGLAGSPTFTIARDGIYDVTFTGTCIDVNANDLITWIFIQPGGTGGVYNLRREFGGVSISNGFDQHICQYLTAGTIVYFHIYNAGGNTRFGANINGGTYPKEALILGLGATIAERR